ncbi:MAG TPA: hypothetical protein DIW44_14625 [Anaerolineaceae bacterium]|nr:hypothetical protein [Anaerolineaceae bacterium]
MKNLQKMGGFAALLMAAAYVVMMLIFIVVLQYQTITDPAQKIALVVDQPNMFFLTNIFGYVFFGVLLVVLCLALYDRLKENSTGLVSIALAVGIIWAGSLVASGMVANAAVAPTIALYTSDPALAANNWSLIETIAGGLGNANGEILGGVFTLLISWAALKSGKLPKALNVLGLLVGLVGIVSLAPMLNNLAMLFGVLQIVWFAWLGIILLSQQKKV